jgi:ketosteroid isomerase-like protein
MKRLILSTIFLASGALAADPAEVLKQADRDFAALSAKEGPGRAFHDFAAPNVTLLNSHDPHATPDVFPKRFGPDTQIAWEPDEAQISAGGDLGYTMGHATITGKDKEGKPTLSHSRYVTIWRKQPDGSWKFIFDGGVDQP